MDTHVTSRSHQESTRGELDAFGKDQLSEDSSSVSEMSPPESTIPVLRTESELKIQSNGFNGSKESGGIPDDSSDNGQAEDKTDARGFGPFGTTSTGVNLVLTGEHDEYYNMTHARRGRALIFNHKVFDAYLNMSLRNGTDEDRDRLKEMFHKLGFDVEVHENAAYKDLMQRLEDVADENHFDASCLVVCFLSHGERGLLYSRDKSFRTEELWERFTATNCPSLAGKPKMFFIQACQGDKLDGGVKLQKISTLETDSGPPKYSLAAYADFLLAYSAVPGFFSWRNTTNGSWFVQALHHVMMQKDMAVVDVVSVM
ncbi:unnamed protein product, partial [Notodromas monacha]